MTKKRFTTSVSDSVLEIFFDGHLIISHKSSDPSFFVGHAELSTKSRGAYYQMHDRVEWRRALPFFEIDGNQIHLSEKISTPPLLTLTLTADTIDIHCTDPEANKFEMNVVAARDEHVWGCGEQFSHLSLRGKRFPLWVGEPGVGRDPNSDFAKNFESFPDAIGDYWTTYYPQPTFVSSKNYALHLPITAYAVFDFTAPTRHAIECYEMPDKIEFFGGKNLVEIVSNLSERFGRQPQLPDWAIEGAIIGLKDGQPSISRLKDIIAAGVVASGLWCEDWAGIRQTDFGRRLFWDWRVDSERFPALEEDIKELRRSGIRFLAYINPYLAVDGSLFQVAADRGYFVLDPKTRAPYVSDFGGFDCGHIDLTNPDAVEWVAEELIGREMLDIGISGWMADFGEYLPTDALLSDGRDAALAHNDWPVLWAKTNSEAIAKRDKTDEAVFFMRSGFSGIGRYCPLLWAGDQSVDYSRHDGIETTIRAALSSGLVGNAYHHSDIAGYTSLFGNVRDACLQKRWAELAAFTPVMRTHEGNRPEDNLQIDSSEDLLSHFARMTRIHARLAPYTRALCQEAEATGLPLQRPLFLHFEHDPICLDIETQYLYGADLLVAPVIAPNTETWRLYLPQGVDWVHVWSDETFVGGDWIEIDAPYGEPPVFHRADSVHSGTFRRLATG